MNNYMTLKKQQHFSPQMDFFFLERVGENMQAILNEKNLPQISFFHLELSLQQSFEWAESAERLDGWSTEWFC